MANFCNGPLWNSTLSWDTNNPNLTPCLRDSILPAVPCGLLWFTWPFWYLWISKFYQPKLKAKTTLWRDKFTKLFTCKMTLNSIVLFICAGELIWRSLDQGWINLYGSEVFYPVCIFISCLLAMVIAFVEKAFIIRSSIPLSLFWPLLTISCIPNVKVEIEMLLENFGKYMI